MPRHLLHVYSTFATGGPQMRFAAIANHYGQRWRHSIIAMDGNLACRERLDPTLGVDYPHLALTKGDTFGNVRRIAGYLRQTRPDLLLTSNWGTIEWAMASPFTGVPHIHVEDGFGPEERTTQIPRRVWTRRICLARRLVVVPSRTLERIATQTWRLNRVSYIPNGINLARFTTPRTRNEIPVIGTVATLRTEKNLPRLLRAFALLQTPARLHIIGGGPELASLIALAATLNLTDRVTFAGHQPDPSRYYAGFDLFAITSDTEQMPLSVLEAMAASLPIVATDVGDIRPMLAPANAPFIVEQSDQAIAKALATLCASAPERTRIGAENRAKACRDYDEETMFEAYAKLFDSEGKQGSAG